MNQSGDDIIEIDGQRYLVPTRLIDGELVPDPDKKIKLPIEITSSFRFTRASTEIDEKQKPTLKQRCRVTIFIHKRAIKYSIIFITTVNFSPLDHFFYGFLQMLSSNLLWFGPVD